MTRAALLPAGSDPFLLAYWLRNFATWSQHVDELRVAICGCVEPIARAYIEALAIPKVTLYFVPKRVEHGRMIAYLLRRTSADHVMLCEDDAFVRRPDVIEECFSYAEAGGIAATTREGFASEEVISTSVSKFGKSRAYWPCFLFVAREHLLATDRHFGGTKWEPGETLLERRLTQPGVSDTMVWMSYQLYGKYLPEKLIDNYRLTGQPIADEAPWFHVGSLSGGHGFMFMSDITPEAYQHEVGNYIRLPDGDALKRISWWYRAWRVATGAIPDYHRRYWVGLSDLMRDLGIPRQNVDWYNQRADALVTWAER